MFASVLGTEFMQQIFQMKRIMNHQRLAVLNCSPTNWLAGLLLSGFFRPSGEEATPFLGNSGRGRWYLSWRHLRVARALPGHWLSAVVSAAEELVAAGSLPGSATAAAEAPSLRTSMQA